MDKAKYVEIPYFMTNEEWYYYDEVYWMYMLTEKAPKEAIESWIEYYGEDVE